MKELPAQVSTYKRTDNFSEKTIPAGLLKSHNTKAGVWGKIVILKGELRYRILEPQIEDHVQPSTVSVWSSHKFCTRSCHSVK